jgi:hypothetical protein
MKPPSRKRTSGKRASINIAGLISGAGGGEAAVAENQPVSPAYAGPTDGAQFYSQSGEVVNQPFADTRNWWQRNIQQQPNVAGQMNNQLALGTAQARSAMPLEIQQQTALGELANKQELARLQGIQELEKPYQPVIASTQPGDIPWQLPVDSAAMVKNRDLTQPYLPVNPASVQGNLKASEDASMAKYRSAQMTSAAQPQYMNIGGALVEIPQGGQPSIRGQTVGGYDVEEPLSYNPKTKQVSGGGKRHIPQSFNLTPKPVGRINLVGGGQEVLGPVMSDQGYYPMSGQTNEFVIGGTGDTPVKVTSQGGPPTTEPQTRLTGAIPEAVRGTGQYLQGAAGAASTALRLPEINELLLKLRKALIRREPVQAKP